MPRTVKVLRIITRLNIGGPAIHAILLTERLGPPFESILVAGSTSATEGDMLDLARRKGVEPVRVLPLGRELSATDDLAAFSQIYRIIRRERPHIVHTHMAKAGTLGRLAARLAGVPVVVHTYHGHVFHSYFGKAKTQLFIQIERALARLTDRIVAVGEVQRREIASFGITSYERVHPIPLGLELDRFLRIDGPGGGLRRELGVSEDTPLVGIVARLVPIKAHEDFMAAAALVHEAVPNAHFAIVGDGERRQELEALVPALGLQGAVHFLGWRSDLPELYADLDVVVLSSLNEGSPVAIIEAMASGKAVVSSRVGGVAEVVTDGVTGVTVPPRSPEQIAAAVIRLLSDESLRAALGSAARREVFPKHSVDRLCDDISRLYLETLAARGLRAEELSVRG